MLSDQYFKDIFNGYSYSCLSALYVSMCLVRSACLSALYVSMCLVWSACLSAL